MGGDAAETLPGDGPRGTPHSPAHAAPTLPDSAAPLSPHATLPKPPATLAAGADPAAATVPGTIDSSAPSSPPAPAGLLVHIGRYRIERALGQGGMGTVYLAHDPELRREVALKLLPDPVGAEQIERFLREARAAAQISHPNLVATWDVGVDGGRHYFTMEVLRGGSVADRLRAAGRLPPREALRIVREAAEGVAHAHAHGIVHRDLKPENLLLAEDGRVKVSDFGVARVIAAEGAERLTRTGVVLGTPGHMAPEQAEGDAAAADARADVYALGSILYELVTGALPYGSGAPMEILFRKVWRDPPPPRRHVPALSPDIETIVLKAMEREPARRYAGAREFADDLDRFLAGQAIAARPAGPWLRARRWVGRHKGASAGVAAALVALALGGGVAWRESAARAESSRRADESRRHAEAERERADRTRQALLDQLRAVAEVSIRATLALRREGILHRQAEFLPVLERAFADATREAPELAEPYYQMGRMRRALLQWKESLALQEEALRRAPDFAPARYERATLAIDFHQNRVADLRAAWLRAEGERLAAAGSIRQGGLGGGAVRPPPADAELVAADPETRRQLDAILDDLRRLEASAARDPGDPHAALSRARLDCARALVLRLTAAGDAEREEARRLLEGALASDPTLTEAYEALAELARARGDEAGALAAYASGLAADKGFPPFYYGRGTVLFLRARREQDSGRDPTESYAAAEADLDTAIRMQDAFPQLWLLRGELRMTWANHTALHGGDAAARYAGAVADFRASLEIAPSLEGWIRLGLVQTNLGFETSRAGHDPEASFAAAEEALNRALALDPSSEEAYLRRGVVSSFRASWDQTHGRDPEPAYRRAEADLTRALELDPNHASAWKYRGTARGNLGRWCSRVGRDPRPAFRESIADLGRALDLDPQGTDALMDRATVRSNEALWVAEHGGDPETLYAEAERDLSRLLEMNPASPGASMQRGSLRQNWANHRQGQGRDAEALFDSAEADYARVLELNPRAHECWWALGALRMNRGVQRTETGADPLPLYEQAEKDLDRCLELSPGSASVWMTRATLRCNRARCEAQQGRDPAPWFARSAEDFRRAAAIDARDPDILVRLGSLEIQWGSVRSRAGEDGGENFERAAGVLDRALAIDPDAVEAHLMHGLLAVHWMDHQRRNGKDTADSIAQGLEHLDLALGRNPRIAEAYQWRGILYHQLRRWAAAVADFEAMAEIRPGMADRTAEVLVEARRRLEAVPAVPPPADAAGWIVAARGGIETGDYAAAGRAYAEALARAAAGGAATEPRDESERTLWREARFNLACIFARRAAGYEGPGGRPRAVPAQEAAAARDQAFAHLREAIRLGWSDAAALRTDLDLAPLRADARWAEAVRDGERGGK